MIDGVRILAWAIVVLAAVGMAAALAWAILTVPVIVLQVVVIGVATFVVLGAVTWAVDEVLG